MLKCDKDRIENFNKFGNIMIDIETLSNKSNASVIAVAAVEFNKYTGDVGDTFIEYVNPKYWCNYNGDTDGETIAWWMTQDADTLRHMVENCQKSENSFSSVLMYLSSFIKDHDSPKTEDTDIVVWGNGSIMDIGILRDGYNKFSIPVPWKFWAINDVRTIVALNPSIKEETEFIGERHNPLDDCLHQIKYLSKTIQSLYIKPISK